MATPKVGQGSLTQIAAFFLEHRGRKASTMALSLICLSMACYVIYNHVPYRHPRVTGNPALTLEKPTPLFSAFGSSPLYPEIVPGISQQAAWRAHLVASSWARSQWELAVSPPSSAAFARTYRRGRPFSGAGESRSRVAEAASSRHATSIQLSGVGSLVLSARPARRALPASTCLH